MRITFLGAAETVTGSKYLLEYGDKKILIDCGLFQGHKEMRNRNWENFFIKPETIDAVILTHAHIDHSGYVPLLVRNGFRGKIFCSKATFDLCSILLPDSGFLQEEDASRANRYGYTKHKPALPLYTEQEARDSLNSFYTVNFNQTYQIDNDIKFVLTPAGHILGAAFVNITCGNRNVVFSGDLGRKDDPIVKAPSFIAKADYLLIESTYGNRLHKKTDIATELKDLINETATKGGTIVIPAFAVGRAQNILFYLHQLKQQKLIPDLPVFLDSPMAIDASEIMNKYSSEHRLDKKLCHEICSVASYVRTSEESKKINQIKVPMIIISASGMAEGGRILHHLKNYISDHKNIIIFTGFQVPGTRGEKIVRGDKTVKIHGVECEINAKIVNLGNSSAHADYEEVLDWLSHFEYPPRKVFVTHGSPETAGSLKEKIERQFGWNVIIPKHLQSEKL
ncbi:MAG: MBL fold metallo-hydrolase [Rickettsiales bacterium]|nr:MBL fold metallo-hydrolase [Rickettsiales bacterium]